MECRAGEDHCCYIGGVVCRYLRDDGPRVARRWVCTLREETGSWAAVHRDPRYQRDVAPTMRTLGVDCGDWPAVGVTCASCEVSG